MYVHPQDAHITAQNYRQAHKQERAFSRDQRSNAIPLSSLVTQLDEVLSDLKRRRALSIHSRLSIEGGEIEAINALSVELDMLRGSIGAALLAHLTQDDMSLRGKGDEPTSAHTEGTPSSNSEVELASKRVVDHMPDSTVEPEVILDIDSNLAPSASPVIDSEINAAASHASLIAERVIDAQPALELPETFQIGTAHWGRDATLTEPELSPLLDHAVIEEPTREELFEFETSEHALNFLEDELESTPNKWQLERILRRAMSSPLKSDDSRLCSLMLGRDLPEGRTFKKLRKEVRILQKELDKEVEEASSPDGDDGWEYAHLFAGQRIELVGGDVVHHVLNRVKRDLPEASVNWTPTSTKSGERTLISLEQSARSGSVDVIILIKSFIGHRVSTRFAPLHGKCFSEGAPLQVRYVSRGYGISKIKRLLLECAQERGLV